MERVASDRRRRGAYGSAARSAALRRVGCAVALSACTVVALGSRADAYYLDDDRNFVLRARLYTETAVSAEDSQPQTKPHRDALEVLSHRTFFNPEFDAKLTPYQPFHLDDLSFRLALWGFYDGIYDYGTSQFDRTRQSIQGRLSRGHTLTAPVSHTDTLIDLRKQYSYQSDPVLGDYGGPGHAPDLPFRINEAYFNVTEGPLFLRLGRQSISWGESDTIGLLDANNPFNLTMGVPGVFQDVDEARIPLWTARASYSLFDSWGPVSSAFLETYLVPGSIDTTVSQVPLPLGSPYSPPQDDPQSLIAGLIPPDVSAGLVKPVLGAIQLGLYDHLPSRTMRNSRYGVRLGGILGREYTTSVWYYRTFANAPVPRFLPLDLSRAPLVRPGATGPTQVITELHHGMVDVFGLATTFFSEPLDGIVRGEMEFFHNEPGFIPNLNIPFERLLRTCPHPAECPRLAKLHTLLKALGQNIPAGKTDGEIPRADIIRFELGYDRFFFLRQLNPANSFIWVTAYVGQWNLSDTFTSENYRFGGQQKLAPGGVRVGANTGGLTLQTIGKLHTVAKDFVDLHPYESFVQTHLQTDYMHGRLTPAITAVMGLNGTFVVPVGLTYRYTDWLLLDLKYAYLGGAFTFPTGYFRDRSQFSARVTLLLN